MQTNTKTNLGINKWQVPCHAYTYKRAGAKYVTYFGLCEVMTTPSRRTYRARSIREPESSACHRRVGVKRDEQGVATRQHDPFEGAGTERCPQRARDWLCAVVELDVVAETRGPLALQGEHLEVQLNHL